MTPPRARRPHDDARHLLSLRGEVPAPARARLTPGSTVALLVLAEVGTDVVWSFTGERVTQLRPVAVTPLPTAAAGRVETAARYDTREWWPPAAPPVTPHRDLLPDNGPKLLGYYPPTTDRDPLSPVRGILTALALTVGIVAAVAAGTFLALVLR